MSDELDRLNGKIAELEKKLANYTAAKFNYEKYQRTFKLTRSEAIFLRLLHTEEVVTKEMLFEELYGDPHAVRASNMFGQLMYNIRNAIRPDRITVFTIPTVGYFMNPYNKDKLTNLVR